MLFALFHPGSDSWVFRFTARLLLMAHLDPKRPTLCWRFQSGSPRQSAHPSTLSVISFSPQSAFPSSHLRYYHHGVETYHQR